MESVRDGPSPFLLSRDVQPRSGPDRDHGPTDRSDRDRTGPTLGSVSVRSRSHVNDSDVGPVLQFSKAIGSVSVRSKRFGPIGRTTVGPIGRM